MNRFGSQYRGSSTTNVGSNSRYYNSHSYPRYSSGVNSDSETSSTHSVRVSRLIEKIKSQQVGGGRGYVPRSDAFNYFQDRNSDLIYSRVEREDSGRGKRTVRERVATRGNGHGEHNSHLEHKFGRKERDTTPLHKTTVLLNNDDSGGDTSGVDYYSRDRGLYSNRYASPPRTQPSTRYFGQETDYEYDRILSRRERENQVQREEERKFGTLRRDGNVGGSARNSVPKIILHEEAVAEIPNGRIAGTRSPSVNREFVTTDDEVAERGNSKGSRFLGGFLTLKRGKKKDLGGGGGSSAGGTYRSATRSPTNTGTRRTASYLNVPGASNRNSDNANDSSSSPKYYVPYHRSTPTLYESTPKFERDRMSSAGGSVLSNGSYVNKHVSRSMSMKHRFAPVHRENVVDYFDENAYKRQQEATERSGNSKLKRSKSMPGKKLTSLIGSWVSKGTLKRQTNGQNEKEHVEDDHERLITTGKKEKTAGNKWGTLLRFGKGGKKAPEKDDRTFGRKSPERPQRGKKVTPTEYSRSSVSPIRVGGRDAGTGSRAVYSGERTGTLLRSSHERKRVSGGTGGGGGRGFY